MTGAGPGFVAGGLAAVGEACENARMLRSGLAIIGVILALLGFAVLAGTDAHAGGVGHHHGAVAATGAPAGPNGRDTAGSSERSDYHDRAAGHGHPEAPRAAGEGPCGDGHGEDGSMCCGVACHAAMPASAADAGLVPTIGLVKTFLRAERYRDRLVLLIERPPRG